MSSAAHGKVRSKKEHVPLYDESQVQIHPEATVCEDIVFKGKVTIGRGSVIHPLTQILAHEGEIIIGEDCLIAENVKIINERAGVKLIIGNKNHFATAAVIQASVGNSNTFGPRCQVLEGAEVSDFCVVGPSTTLRSRTLEPSQPERIPPYTTIFGAKSERRIWGGETADQENHVRHIEYLREVLPKFVRIRK